jgi:hypothetical protein
VVLTASCLLTASMSFLNAPASEQPFHTIWSCRSFDIFGCACYYPRQALGWRAFHQYQGAQVP